MAYYNISNFRFYHYVFTFIIISIWGLFDGTKIFQKQIKRKLNLG